MKHWWLGREKIKKITHFTKSWEIWIRAFQKNWGSEGNKKYDFCHFSSFRNGRILLQIIFTLTPLTWRPYSGSSSSLFVLSTAPVSGTQNVQLKSVPATPTEGTEWTASTTGTERQKPTAPRSRTPALMDWVLIQLGRLPRLRASVGRNVTGSTLKTFIDVTTPVVSTRRNVETAILSGIMRVVNCQAALWVRIKKNMDKPFLGTDFSFCSCLQFRLTTWRLKRKLLQRQHRSCAWNHRHDWVLRRIPLPWDSGCYHHASSYPTFSLRACTMWAFLFTLWKISSLYRRWFYSPPPQSQYQKENRYAATKKGCDWLLGGFLFGTEKLRKNIQSM